MAGARIRIVEDNDDLFMLTRLLLTRGGQEIAERLAPIDCLLPEAWEGIDLGIVDLMMPDVSGVTILRYVREHHRHVKLLVVTAAAEHTRQEAVEWADEMLGKPFDVEDLFAAVDRLVGER